MQADELHSQTGHPICKVNCLGGLPVLSAAAHNLSNSLNVGWNTLVFGGVSKGMVVLMVSQVRLRLSRD